MDPSSHDNMSSPMYGDEERAKSIIRRLKTIEGHIRGIQKMVNDGSSSIDIMKQIKAVTQALEKVNALTLEGHFKHMRFSRPYD